jgi:hypothetical protein
MRQTVYFCALALAGAGLIAAQVVVFWREDAWNAQFTRRTQLRRKCHEFLQTHPVDRHRDLWRRRAGLASPQALGALLKHSSKAL